jgi:hypothetical protein
MQRSGGAAGEWSGVSRRAFIHRAGIFGAALATIDLAALLDANGLLEEARAQSPDLTFDTLSGLVAFVVPGDDPYSIAQGERAQGPGGIAAGGVGALIAGLDRYVPVTTFGGSASLPASGGVAVLLNQFAERVNPLATGGGFPSPFARLSFAEKASVLQLFEGDASMDGTELRFVAGILPGFVAFVSFSETGVRQPGHVLSGRPVGWGIASYGGPAEGHAELRGYYRGHRSAAQPRKRARKGSR